VQCHLVALVYDSVANGWRRHFKSWGLQTDMDDQLTARMATLQDLRSCVSTKHPADDF
jgi:hypothetical protein